MLHFFNFLSPCRLRFLFQLYFLPSSVSLPRFLVFVSSYNNPLILFVLFISFIFRSCCIPPLFVTPFFFFFFPPVLAFHVLLPFSHLLLLLFPTLLSPCSSVPSPLHFIPMPFSLYLILCSSSPMSRLHPPLPFILSILFLLPLLISCLFCLHIFFNTSLLGYTFSFMLPHEFNAME